MYKTCTQCGFELNTSWFRTEPRTKEGLQSVCRMCESLWREGYRSQPEVVAQTRSTNSEYYAKHRRFNLDPSTRDKDKKCYECQNIKPASEFPSSGTRRGGLRADCKACNRKRTSQNIRRLREEVFCLLGDDCVRCGFTDKRALQIDHVFGGGNKEHAIIKNAQTFLKKVIAQAESGIYQILCANCNWIKRHERDENPVGPRVSA